MKTFNEWQCWHKAFGQFFNREIGIRSIPHYRKQYEETYEYFF